MSTAAFVSAAVLDRSPAWRAERRTGEVLARIDGDAGEVQQFAFNALLTGSSSILRLAGGAAMLFVLNWKLALLAVALAPFELAFFALARPRTERLARETRAERGDFAGQIAEMVAGEAQPPGDGIGDDQRERSGDLVEPARPVARPAFQRPTGATNFSGIAGCARP